MKNDWLKRERKSQSHEKELLVTPPPELSERNLRILPQDYQPPQGYHLPQGYQPPNPAPIIIMAPENLTSGMFNMLPGMGTFQNNYLNSLLPIPTLAQQTVGRS